MQFPVGQWQTSRGFKLNPNELAGERGTILERKHSHSDSVTAGSETLLLNAANMSEIFTLVLCYRI